MASFSFRPITFLMILFVIGCGSDDNFSSNDNDHLDPEFDPTLAEMMSVALENSVDANNVTGAVLAVQSPDGTSWKDATGYAIEENETEMSTNLHFRIGSISKTFTSTMILILVDYGLLSLDNTINEVVPEFDILMGDTITVRDLLQMRSGLEKYLANPNFTDFYLYDPGRIWDPEELIEYANIQTSDPGTTFLYNNSNYIILGLMIEKLMLTNYAQALKELILNPLYLFSTQMPLDGNMPIPFANGYNYDSDADMTINQTYYLNPSIAWSAGGLISNADDLLRWANAYFNGTLISPTSHENQFDLLPVTTTENPVIEEYGFGAMKDGILIGHDGYIPPFGSWVARYKDYHFVLLINGNRETTEEPVFIATTVLTDVINAVDTEL